MMISERNILTVLMTFIMSDNDKGLLKARGANNVEGQKGGGGQKPFGIFYQMSLHTFTLLMMIRNAQ